MGGHVLSLRSDCTRWPLSELCSLADLEACPLVALYGSINHRNSLIVGFPVSFAEIDGNMLRLRLGSAACWSHPMV